MRQFSEVPVPNGREVVNDGFGCRCDLCGQYFDEGGFCNNGHEQGRTYYLLGETAQEPKPAEFAPKHTQPAMITCAVFNSCTCNICGGLFSDGDDICGLGGHQIGHQYPNKLKRRGGIFAY